MTNEVADNLTKEKIQQLLAAVGHEPHQDAEQNTEAPEHNWRQPHYFSGDQLKIIQYFAERVAAATSCKFGELYHSDFEVTAASTSLHFASELLNPPADNKQPDFYLTFGTSQNPVPETQTDIPENIRPCGAIAIPHETAIIWTTELLGDAKSEEDSTRDLSQLEESLLSDIASLLVKAFSDSCDKQDFHQLNNVVVNQFPLEMEKSEELCKIDLDIKKADSENTSKPYFLIRCNKLEPVIGTTAQAADEISTEDISKAITRHLQQMNLSVTAQLGTAYLTFEELVGLGTDDILLLDKKVNEPVELLVEGLELLYGRPAKSAGKYAIAITKTKSDNAR